MFKYNKLTTLQNENEANLQCYKYDKYKLSLLK